MATFTVELQMFKLQIVEAEHKLMTTCGEAGVQDHPELLHLRRLVRELCRTIDALHEAAPKT